MRVEAILSPIIGEWPHDESPEGPSHGHQAAAAPTNHWTLVADASKHRALPLCCQYGQRTAPSNTLVAPLSHSEINDLKQEINNLKQDIAFSKIKMSCNKNLSLWHHSIVRMQTNIRISSDFLLRWKIDRYYLSIYLSIYLSSVAFIYPNIVGDQIIWSEEWGYATIDR